MANKYDEIVQKLKGEVCPGIKATHLSDEQLSEAERFLGVSLPPQYREFLRDNGNYCFFEGNEFSVAPNPHTRAGLPVHYNQRHPQNTGSVSMLYGLDPIRTDELHRRLEMQCNNSEEWPREWLPIGDAGVDLIGLAIQGEHRGCVYYFVLNQHEDYLVANSFDEFMHKVELVYDEEDE